MKIRVGDTVVVIAGKDTFTNLSKNSYILSPRKVTLQPIA